MREPAGPRTFRSPMMLTRRLTRMHTYGKPVKPFLNTVVRDARGNGFFNSRYTGNYTTCEHSTWGLFKYKLTINLGLLDPPSPYFYLTYILADPPPPLTYA